MPPTSTNYSATIEQTINKIIEEDLLPRACQKFIDSEYSRQTKAMGKGLRSNPEYIRNAITKRTAVNSKTAYIEYKRNIIQKIEELFSPLTLNHILVMFFKRHPWLEKELSVKNEDEELLAKTLAAQFFKNLISHRIEKSELNLTLTEKEEKLDNWSKRTKSYFEITVDYKQKKIDIKKIEDEIHACPLKEINYFDKSNTKITNLRNTVYNAAMGRHVSMIYSTALSRSRRDKQQHELQLSRIDIYRYLNENYPQKIAVKN